MLPIRGYHHFLDLEFLAGLKSQIRAAAGAQRDLILQLHVRIALHASGVSRNFDDFQLRARQGSARGRDVEAKAERGGDHPGKFADLNLDSEYLGIADAMSDRVHDIPDDCQLMHQHQSLAIRRWGLMIQSTRTLILGQVFSDRQIHWETRRSGFARPASRESPS